METAVSAPPATKQRVTTFTVTDTAQNIGTVSSGPSVTRYYLSLDAPKSTGDTMLTGSRSLPALAAGGSHTGTVTLTIPTATVPNTYFLLACADGSKRSGGDGRDQQLPGIQHGGDDHAVDSVPWWGPV